MKHVPLYRTHVDAGAKMAPFAGWEMPIQYPAGSIEEHRLVRRSAGLFDVSHMGRLKVTGTGAAAYLDRLVSSSIAKLGVNESTYGLLCNESGGVIDDLFVYRLAESWLVVVNASNAEKDIAWFRSHLPESGATLTDVSDQTVMFAFQGPQAIALLDHDTGGRASAIERFHAALIDVCGVPCTVGRTGYTGEDGVELFAAADHAERLWTGILALADRHGVDAGPIGLAARDSLRFEPGFPLYGHELDEQTTPVEARLTWACDPDTDFIGRDAILERKRAGAERKLATVVMEERGVPRQGCDVYHEDRCVGVVTTGLYAPTVDAFCANVYVESELARTGSIVHIDIRGGRKRAVVASRPLYKPAYR
ncbi:MAG: glycine cleavage system aminomethyltransferase GcvT [Spirochaetaceae bacterium]|nr:MAG: glycine cleavage system aminomethyltransferase GcvT [Spirochaetaceae bacterium]